MKLSLPEGFPTEVHVLDTPDAALLPSGTWTLVGDQALKESWRKARLPEPEGTLWVSVDENHKRLQTLVPWLERWAEIPLHRNGTVVALGGGVLTDMVGLAASLFLRGLPWQAWPTTLLAQVDAGLGGKTAVNLGAGKNLAGAFHPPQRFVACTNFLRTLPQRDLKSGRWELVKTALIQGDLAWAEALLGPDVQAADIARALAFKADVVHRDLREQHERRLLNLGHTLGHALEAGSEHHLFHGEAVGFGLLAACLLAEEQGLGSFPDPFLKRLVLELRPLANLVPDWDSCEPWIHRDKKAWTDPGHPAQRTVHCILPQPSGPALQRPLPPEAWASPHARMCSLLR